MTHQRKVKKIGGGPEVESHAAAASETAMPKKTAKTAARCVRLDMPLQEFSSSC
jgi:hypothetical protein